MKTKTIKACLMAFGMLATSALSAQSYEVTQDFNVAYVNLPTFKKNAFRIGNNTITVGSTATSTNGSTQVFAYRSDNVGTVLWASRYQIDGNMKGISVHVRGNNAFIAANEEQGSILVLNVNVNSGALIDRKRYTINDFSEVSEIRGATINGAAASVVAGNTFLEVIKGGVPVTIKVPFILAVENATLNIIYSRIYNEVNPSGADMSLSDIELAGGSIRVTGQYNNSEIFRFNTALNTGNLTTSLSVTTVTNRTMDPEIGKAGPFIYGTTTKPNGDKELLVRRQGSSGWINFYRHLSLPSGSTDYDALGLFRDNGFPNHVRLFARAGRPTTGYRYFFIEIDPSNGNEISTIEYTQNGLSGSMIVRNLGAGRFWTANTRDEVTTTRVHQWQTTSIGTTECSGDAVFLTDDLSQTIVTRQIEALVKGDDKDINMDQIDVDFVTQKDCATSKSLAAGSTPTQQLAAALTLKTFPNPVSAADNNLKVVITSPLESAATLEIMDYTGRQVAVQNVVLIEGEQTLNFSTTDLPAGLHFIRLTVNGETISNQKFIKQ